MHHSTFEHWEPITDGNARIQAALQEAHVPTLLLALVHLTGDLSLLRGDIRPSGDFLSTIGDPQAGLTAAQQATVRARALEELQTYRDTGRRLPPPPSADAVHEMISFLTGQTASPDYVAFLMDELALDGRDPYLQPVEAPAAVKRAYRVAIIGAGMSGLLTAIRLGEAGIPYVVLEKNPDVGGTWFENTYPGCRVDCPNHVYSYSFEPYDWPQHFSPQQALLDYFRRCTDKYRLRDAVRFETEVERLEHDDVARRWKVHVRTRDGRRETLEANAVVSAVGQLNRPRYPDIPGRERFEGIAFHSARWQHQHDLTGKRVVVIGTGASVFQFVPAVAEQARELVIFQRTPPWVVPNPDYHADISAEKRWLLHHVPLYAKWYRFWMFWRTAEGLLSMVKVDPAWPHQDRSVSEANDLLRLALTENIELMLGGHGDLLEKSIPHYPPAGKRMLIDSGSWYQALTRPNVQLVTDPVTGITASGVRTKSGGEYPADVLIYGTGFQASHFLSPMRVTGRDGVDLHAHWAGEPRAYLGITIPGFPNLFCLYGPNTNIVVNGSIIFFSECAVRYVMGCLALLLQSDHASMECRRDVHDAYNAMIDAKNAEMAWGAPNVTSWYKNANGRVTQNWPLTLLEFWSRTKHPNPADFAFG